jgi:hypothetical protein
MTIVVRQVLTALLSLSLAAFSVLAFVAEDAALYAALTAAASMTALCVLASGAGRTVLMVLVGAALGVLFGALRLTPWECAPACIGAITVYRLLTSRSRRRVRARATAAPDEPFTPPPLWSVAASAPPPPPAP